LSFAAANDTSPGEVDGPDQTILLSALVGGGQGHGHAWPCRVCHPRTRGVPNSSPSPEKDRFGTAKPNRSLPKFGRKFRASFARGHMDTNYTPSFSDYSILFSTLQGNSGFFLLFFAGFFPHLCIFNYETAENPVFSMVWRFLYICVGYIKSRRGVLVNPPPPCRAEPPLQGGHKSGRRGRRPLQTAGPCTQSRRILRRGRCPYRPAI